MSRRCSSKAAAQTFVDLEFEKVMTREDLQQRAKEKSLYGRWARRMLGLLDAGATFPKTYPYAVQAWRVGDQLFPAEAFETRFHRPEMVRRALKGEALPPVEAHAPAAQ